MSASFRKPFARMTMFLAVLAIGWVAGCASAGPQPQMRAALAALRDARAHLLAATGDKGGHRTRAVSHVDRAIDEVQKGIAWDRRH